MRAVVADTKILVCDPPTWILFRNDSGNAAKKNGEFDSGKGD